MGHTVLLILYYYYLLNPFEKVVGRHNDFYLACGNSCHCGFRPSTSVTPLEAEVIVLL